MDLGLAGRRVLVTGGSRGIGRECALSFARAGSRIAIDYVSNSQAAAKTRQNLLALGAEAHAVKADVTDLGAVRWLVREVHRLLGGLDILVHSAGIAFQEGDEVDETEKWDRILRSHLHSTYYLCREAKEGMKAQRWGRIIVIGSIAGRGSGSSPYSVAKAAQSHYVRGLASELGPYSITVNVVSPGRVNTDMIPGTEEDWVAYARSVIPLYRERDDYPGPDLIGDVVAFLASEPARYISGADLHVSGAAYAGL
jgi:3-oxoacyl-[acyl-carrier protein] reductase